MPHPLGVDPTGAKTVLIRGAQHLTGSSESRGEQRGLTRALSTTISVHLHQAVVREYKGYFEIVMDNYYRATPVYDQRIGDAA